MKMQTNSHIEVVSPNRCYAYSRHTERIFGNYESPCQTRINPMLAKSLLHYTVCYIQKILHTFVISVFKFHHNTTAEM